MLRHARSLCLFVFAVPCAGAWAQTAVPGQATVPGTTETQSDSDTPGTQPAAETAGKTGVTNRGTNSLTNPADTLEQSSPLQTSVQQQVNQGLVPTLESGISTSAFANGIVSTFPGATSFGAGAANAAANSQKFLTVYATQAVAYSDNPGQLGAGQITGPIGINQGLNSPDFYEVTSGGVLFSKQISLQNFFASANFSVTNYAHDTNFNQNLYSLSAGDNYAISDECAGTIVANQSQNAVPLQFTVGSLSSQSTQNTSGEITSRCKVTGHIYTTADLKASRNSFLNAAIANNNQNQYLGSAGIEYSRPSFITMGFMTSVQQTDFSGQNTLLLGLSSRSSQVNFDVFISKPISPKLSVSLSGGISDLSTGSPSLSGSIQPLFTAAVNYAYSPKTSLFFSYSNVTGSPQSFVSNFQQIETIAVGVSYRYSPKIAVSANINRSSTSGGGATSGAQTVLSQLLANSQSSSEQISASYDFYRGASASLSYQHTNRDAGFLFGQADVNIVSFALSYRR